MQCTASSQTLSIHQVTYDEHSTLLISHDKWGIYIFSINNSHPYYQPYHYTRPLQVMKVRYSDYPWDAKNAAKSKISKDKRPVKSDRAQSYTTVKSVLAQSNSPVK